MPTALQGFGYAEEIGLRERVEQANANWWVAAEYVRLQPNQKGVRRRKQFYALCCSRSSARCSLSSFYDFSAIISVCSTSTVSGLYVISKTMQFDRNKKITFHQLQTPSSSALRRFVALITSYNCFRASSSCLSLCLVISFCKYCISGWTAEQ